MNISRYIDSNNIEIKFKVEFITPCFLGGADGNAEVRVAPFKNLIRRWWRIVNGNLSPEELWQKEAELFGSTEKNPRDKDGKSFGKSLVELRITDESQVNYSDDPVKFDEKAFKETSKGKIPVDVPLYLGYGAITNKGTKKYIKAGSKCIFSMKLPISYKDELEKTLFYINLFGSIGAKSKNGFGSIMIIYAFNPQKQWPSYEMMNQILKNKKNYPNAICKDENGILAWQTKETFDSWEDAMKALCDCYLTTKEWLKDENKNWPQLLGFAKGDSRMPSQVILKVSKKSQSLYYGAIIHIPYQVNFITEQINASNYLNKCFDYQDGLLTGLYGRNITGGTK